MGTLWWPAADSGGTAPRPGPSADAVAVVAQRLAGIARDLDALRQQLGGLLATDWTSPAASAFWEALSSCNVALAVAIQKIESAAVSVGSYGVALQQESASCAALQLNLRQGTPGVPEFVPLSGYGFGPDWGTGF